MKLKWVQAGILSAVIVLGMLLANASQATEYLNRIKCTQMQKGGGKVSLTFLDGDWNISNDAIGIIILRDGNETSIEKANMHFDNEKYAYTVDADANSPILQKILSGNTITLTGRLDIPNYYTVSGTKNKFQCETPLASLK